MTRKTLLTLVVVSALGSGTGCSLLNKEEGSAATGTAEAEPPPADTGAADAPPTTGDEVASYPNMVPQGGTKKTLQAFKVYQAADPTSKMLTSIGPGTLINLKGSYGNWMLIEWPSGVGKLSPGWIELRLNDTRVTDVKTTTADAGTDAGTADAGTADAGTTATDAGAGADAGTGAQDAGAADAGTRGRIKLNIPSKK